MPATPNDLTRTTVNLIRRSVDALDELHASLDLSKTDIINRSIQVYRFLQELMDENGGSSIVVVRKDGSVERIHIL